MLDYGSLEALFCVVLLQFWTPACYDMSLTFAKKCLTFRFNKILLHAFLFQCSVLQYMNATFPILKGKREACLRCGLVVASIYLNCGIHNVEFLKRHHLLYSPINACLPPGFCIVFQVLLVIRIKKTVLQFGSSLAFLNSCKSCLNGL